MTLLNRRTLIKNSSVAAMALCAPSLARATPRIGRDRLWIRRADTGESLNDCFVYSSEVHARAAWAVYSHFWRDVRDNGQMVWIDRGLLGVLSDLQGALSSAYGRELPLVLNSGYRTRQRNLSLVPEGAAVNSRHVTGQAADFTVPGVTPSDVAGLAERVRGVGGVGRYSRFTHVDTGPSGRRWGTN